MNYKYKIHLYLPSGGAVAGAVLGPVLGQYNITPHEFCQKFNQESLIFKKNIPINCFIHLDDTFNYTIEITHPNIIYYLFKLTLIEKGKCKYQKKVKFDVVLNPFILSIFLFEFVIFIKKKHTNISFYKNISLYKMILGLCKSAGILVIPTSVYFIYHNKFRT